jgi:hypothetical protein
VTSVGLGANSIQSRFRSFEHDLAGRVKQQTLFHLLSFTLYFSSNTQKQKHTVLSRINKLKIYIPVGYEPTVVRAGSNNRCVMQPGRQHCT